MKGEWIVPEVCCVIIYIFKSKSWTDLNTQKRGCVYGICV